MSRLFAEPWTARLSVSSLYVTPEFADAVIGEAIICESGRSGFVVYGPYTSLLAGRYRVVLELDAGPGAVFEVVAFGRPIVQIPATAGTEVLFELPTDADEVEFRLQLAGGALNFSAIRLERIDAQAPAGTAFASPLLEDLPARLWRAVHEGVSDRAVAALAGGLAPDSVDAWCAGLAPIRTIAAWSEASLQASALALRQEGLDLRAVRLCGADSIANEADLAQIVGETALSEQLRGLTQFTEDGFASPFLQGMAAQQGAAQLTALLGGVVFCPCPFTGAILVSRHCFPVAAAETKQCHLFYYFSGVRPFYLCVAGFTGRKTFIYIPETETVLQIGPPQYDWGDHQMPISLLRRYVVLNAADYARYLSRETVTTVLAGTINNVGHYLWNDIAGLTRCDAAGLTRQVGRVLAYRHCYLPPDLGLESATNVELLRAEDPEALITTVLRSGSFCVRPTALAVSPEAARRVRARAASLLAPECKARIEAVREADLVVWFNLRTHNKVWRQQAEAAVLIAERAAATGNRLALVLDGMADCNELAEMIQRAAPPSTQIVAAFDLPFHESICWADACDAYVATIGSGLALVTWVSGLPGLAHSEQAHMNQLEFWGEVRPDAPFPLAPPADAIRDLGQGGAYCDYDLDAGLVVDLFWPKLLQHAQNARTPAL